MAVSGSFLSRSSELAAAGLVRLDRPPTCAPWHAGRSGTSTPRLPRSGSAGFLVLCCARFVRLRCPVLPGGHDGLCSAWGTRPEGADDVRGTYSRCSCRGGRGGGGGVPTACRDGAPALAG